MNKNDAEQVKNKAASAKKGEVLHSSSSETNVDGVFKGIKKTVRKL